MSNIYIEYNFTVSPKEPGTEILIAQLGYAGFESFDETENGVLAYIQKDEWNEDVLTDIQILGSSEFKIEHVKSEIDQVNWNEEWEKNFEAIEVDGTCVVRAPFHPKRNLKYEIIIEPKMSFGTGHHETTFMMLQYILENDFKGKSVLDMGCGTAVLAILAAMRGAEKVDAIDIDQWCFENSEENVLRNNQNHIMVYLGDSELLSEKKYDIIIANINRNILLDDLPKYRESLNPNGLIFLSGFYVEDLNTIKKTCNKLNLKFVDNKERNNWVAAKFNL